MLPHVLDFFFEGSQLVIKYQSFVYDARRRCAYHAMSEDQSKLPRPIPWNQTSDVHRGSTLITWR